MATPREAALVELARRYQRLIAGHANRTAEQVGRLYDDLARLDDDALAQFSTAAAETVTVAQETAVTMSSGYINAYVSHATGDPLDVVLNIAQIAGGARGGTVSPADVYARSIVTARGAIADGLPLPAAMARGRTRATSTADTDVMLAARAGATETMTAAGPRVQGYRRVLSGRSCAFCATASSQRYKSDDLMPMHPRCDCGVAPIIGELDPGQVINHKLLADLRARGPQYWEQRGFGVDADGNIFTRKPKDRLGTTIEGNDKAWRDRRPVRFEVHEHGELGPTIGAGARNAASGATPAQWRTELDALLADGDPFAGFELGKDEWFDLGQMTPGPQARAAEAKVRQIGGVIDDEARRRMAELGIRTPDAVLEGNTMRALNDRLNAIDEARWEILNVEKDRLTQLVRDGEIDGGEMFERFNAFKAAHPDIPRLDAELRQVAEQIDTAREQFRTIRAEFGPAWQRSVRSVLDELELGSADNIAFVHTADASLDHIDAMKRAASNYPKRWGDALNRRSGIEIMDARDAATFGEDLARGFAADHRIWLGAGPDTYSTAVHELGHSLEMAVPSLQRLEWVAWHRRAGFPTDASQIVKQINGYRPGEVAFEDDWFTTYIGKWYGGNSSGLSSQYEIASMGMETIFGDRYVASIPLDADHMRMMLGALVSF